MSAFTGPLAQVREALNKPWCPNLGSCPPEMHSGCSYCAAHEDALAALAQVERLATDMETALGEMEAAVRPALGTMAYYFGPNSRVGVSRESSDRFLRIKAATDNARAVLSAREEGAHYDHETHQWVGQCPHGDVCTGCDARGYCTREEGADTR